MILGVLQKKSSHSLKKMYILNIPLELLVELGVVERVIFGFGVEISYLIGVFCAFNSANLFIRCSNRHLFHIQK